MLRSNPIRSAFGRFITLLSAGIGIASVTGLVHGRLTQRWGPVPDLQAAARNLEGFPTEIGDWQMVSEEPMKKYVRRMLSCAGYVNRQYVDRTSGQKVSLAIIVGPPGPTAVHTPEICYSSRAYSIDKPRRRATLSDKDGRTHSFWAITFRRKNVATSDQLRVCYAWASQETWKASQSPRFAFGGQRLLFKLQIAAFVSSAPIDNTQDPCLEFLSALLQSDWNINVEDK